MVIVACNNMTSVQPFPIAPALLAPAQYTETVSAFLRRGCLETPPATMEKENNEADWEVKTGKTSSDRATTGPPPRQRRHNTMPAWKELEIQAKEHSSNNRVRRGAVIPGTRASKHPNKPTPFVIKVEDGAIFLELVAHIHGAGKDAHRLAVQWVGRGRESDGEVVGEEAAGARCATFTAGIPVEVADTKDFLDGIHGAPVFLGGRLFGFALQVRNACGNLLLSDQKHSRG